MWVCHVYLCIICMLIHTYIYIVLNICHCNLLTSYCACNTYETCFWDSDFLKLVYAKNYMIWYCVFECYYLLKFKSLSIQMYYLCSYLYAAIKYNYLVMSVCYCFRWRDITLYYYIYDLVKQSTDSVLFYIHIIHFSWS